MSNIDKILRICCTLFTWVKSNIKVGKYLLFHKQEIPKNLLKPPKKHQFILSINTIEISDNTAICLSISQTKVFFQALPIPTHLIVRPEHYQVAKNHLLFKTFFSSKILPIISIQGLSGTGKSILASALAHSKDIQFTFPDGVLWATLGQNPDLLTLINNWIQTLGDFHYKPTTLNAASTYLQTLLHHKKVLLILDDVWNPEHIQPFQVKNTNCCLLITTRQTRIPGAKHYTLDGMTSEQALTLFAKILNRQITPTEQQRAETLAKAVGYLPIALEAIATQIADGITWTELLTDLQAEADRLEPFYPLHTEITNPEAKQKYLSAIAACHLNLRQLSPEQLRYFTLLANLPKNETITPALAASLWQVSLRQASAILRTFQLRTLLLPGITQPDDSSTYRLHDLLHDIVQYTLSEKQITLPETYIIDSTQNSALQQVDSPDELLKFLPRTAATEEHYTNEIYDPPKSNPDSSIDFFCIAHLAETLTQYCPSPEIALQFRQALGQAFLKSLEENIPIELMVELVKYKVWTPEQGLAYAQKIQDSSQTPYALSSLAPYLPEVFLAQALEIAEAIQSDSSRADALGEIAPYLPDSLLSQAFAAVCAIRSESSRAHALSKLVPYLPDAFYTQVFKVVQSIKSEFSRTSVFTQLAPHLPQSLLPEILSSICAIHNESSRAYALNSLFPYLPESLLLKALESIRLLQDEFLRATTLIKLIPSLPSILAEAIETTCGIQDESCRARALVELANHLPTSLIPKAIEAASTIKNESARVYTLRQLLPKA